VTTIWDPFVGSGRSARLWKKLGFNVLKHASIDDFFDPKGPVAGRDYDFMITNPPFNLTRDLFRRLSHEPRFITFMMNDTLGRRYYDRYDTQLIHLTHGIRFFKMDGTQHKTAHPSCFTWLCKGLALPKDTIWMDEYGKIRNWKQLSRKQKGKYADCKPDVHLSPSVNVKGVKWRIPWDPHAAGMFNFKISKKKSSRVRIRIREKSAPNGMSAMDLLHRRLGHASENYLRWLYHFPTGMKLSWCDVCAKAKLHRAPFKHNSAK
jgi:hypothetical protein